MTEAELFAIRERERAATPGKWGWLLQAINIRPLVRGVLAGRTDSIVPIFDTDVTLLKADAEFIAHARADVPALLDEVFALRAALVDLIESYSENARFSNGRPFDFPNNVPAMRQALALLRIEPR